MKNCVIKSFKKNEFEGFINLFFSAVSHNATCEMRVTNKYKGILVLHDWLLVSCANAL